MENKKIFNKIKSNFFGRIPLPQWIVIDPVSSCNLKCPLCPTGTGDINKKKIMSLENFRIIIDKFPNLKGISLFNWGEPFLNSQIFDIIKYAKSRKILTLVHTNFSLKKDNSFFKKIIDSGLDILSLSIDGASHKTYSKYRIGGNLELVLSNLRKLILEKKTQKSETPKIIWKFIVNKYNEKEIEKAREMANSLGIDFKIACIKLDDVLPDIKFNGDIEKRKKQWLPSSDRYREKHYSFDNLPQLYDAECPFLFNDIMIDPSGEVFPCCYVTDAQNSFGNLLKTPLEDIWYGKKYSYSRSLFRPVLFKPKETDTICSKCRNFRKYGNRK